MKHSIIAIVLIMFVLTGISQSTVHAVKFKSLMGAMINMENYRGWKLIVYTAAGMDDFGAVKKLTPLVEGSDSLIVVIVPINDFNNSNIGTSAIKFLKDSLPKNFIVSDISNAKNRAVSNEHPLLNWLSNKNQNTHFDFDFNESGQALFINAKGELYGNILRCDFNAVYVKKILNIK